MSGRQMAMAHRVVAICIILASTLVRPVIAGGPTKVASVDRSRWPYAIDSPAAFDRASRSEILAFTHAFAALPWNKDVAAWQERLGVKSPNIESLGQWKARIQQVLQDNFAAASQGCAAQDAFCPADRISDWDHLVKFANIALANPPPNFRKWVETQSQFYESYVYEQARLAALFPAITSEILVFNASELMGDGFKDKTFLLTFDDGPTAHAGNTDRLIALLREQGVNGTFFVLGEHLAARIKQSSIGQVEALYAGMCIGSHGWEHNPHPKMANWSESIDRSAELIQQVLPPGQESLRYLRFPYGQRTPEMVAYLSKKHMNDMLWDIDSQDWNSKIAQRQVGDRVTTLMLLWRRGIVLFHDVHAPVQLAIPNILANLRHAGIVWQDCHKL